AWTNLPARWTRYQTPLTVSSSGTLDLEIIAPSSFGAPPGRIWIDDVELLETAMPPLTKVSDGKGFDDEPSMARAADGGIYVAWVSFRGGWDSLQVARYRRDGSRLERLGAWEVLGGAGTYILGPRVVAAGEKAIVLAAVETEKRWDIIAVPCGAEGPGKAIAVTRDAAADINPAGAWRDGTLWIAWESNRNGARGIFAASLRDGRSTAAVPVSAPGISSYCPAIACDRGGIAVAWYAFRDDNYDIFLRRMDGTGSWAPEVRLTRAPSIDRHPVLVPRDDGLWLLYENAQTTGYRIGATNHRRLIAARIRTAGLEAPRAYRTTSPLYGRCEAASGAFDAAGRLWITHLRPQLPRAGWEIALAGFAGDRWIPSRPVAGKKGMDRRPAIAIDGDAAVIVFQADELPRSWSDLDLAMEAPSEIFLAAVDLAGETPAAAPALEPLVEPDEAFEAGEIRIARGEDAPTPSISYKGETLRLFYGDLHEHTDVSVCNRVGDQSIEESYQHMRDIAHLDFACVTDHGYNHNPYLWAYTAELARANDDPDRFLTFLGEEWTSTFEEYDTEHPYGFYGHRNLVLADAYFPRWWNARNRQTPAQVWEDLRRMRANFVHIPHQLADTGNVPTDWDFTDPIAQPVAEIFQIRGSYEYKGTPREAGRTTPAGHFLHDAWARGIVIGVIASPDHGGGMGKACVFAPELTREAILDALRARRCFGTTAARIVLDVRVDGHLMGETAAGSAPRPVRIEIDARAPAAIERIEVCRNNAFIWTANPKAKEARLTFSDEDPIAGRSYYYVRLIQEDGEIAWSSPVWFGVE
ncbi:MAG: CehA/McbA family metallohydrolase, partial [Planctomycetes bacterium]|nr:CehA/McbA family metallohydrolase [Planctomycetota bacterium]